jgi:FlaA1/EpsC-like NDP-sugar epimerase
VPVSDDAVIRQGERVNAYGRARPKDATSQVSVSIWASRVRARLLFVLLDALVVVAGYSAAEVIYLRDRAPAHYWSHFVVFLAVALVVQLGCNQLFGLYGRMWRHAGIEEARQIVFSALTALTILVALHPVGHKLGVENVDLAVVVVGSIFVTMGMGILRFHSRLFAWQRGSKRLGLRVAVIGSRDAGASAVREMLRNPRAGLVPVAIFDDDPKSHGLSISGVPVVGSVDDIPAAAVRYEIQQVLLAHSSPTPDLVNRALRSAETADIVMKILPGVRELVGGVGERPALVQARSPQIEDLLGRNQIATDLDAVRRSLAGRRVLVTGAGGSIGSEISRQVALFDPALVVLLDHDETHLHDAAASVVAPNEQALVDVADRAAVFEAFARYQPEVVFHAAAHKHVPILETHPVEAATTNVFGTRNVVDAAAEIAERFVFISTDKAVRPASVMGAAKWLGEQIVRLHAPHGAPYCAVRFGNVLGSRGSVIPTFARQIEAGGPVTVTDPRMTRYFMSVEEAVQLVLQASVLATGGDIFMLEMGEPVQIIELAQRMIRLSGYNPGTDIPIRVIGIRPGEKLHEELSTPDEPVHPTAHPSIRRLTPTPVDPLDLADHLVQLDESTAKRDAETVRELLFSLTNVQPAGDEAAAWAIS